MPHEIRLCSGRLFDYEDARNFTPTLHEIATPLSRIPRFMGATRKFYSVAQHAVYVSQLVQQKIGPRGAMYALHHDDHEAFTGDWPTPLKRYLFSLLGRDVAEEISDTLDAMVYENMLKLDWPIPEETAEEIRIADYRMYVTEGTQLIRNFVADDPKVHAADFRVECYGPEQAEAMFLQRHAGLERLIRRY